MTQAAVGANQINTIRPDGCTVPISDHVSYFDSVVRVDICAQASVKVLRQLQPQSGGYLFTARRLHCAQSDYISLDFTSMPSSLEHILVDIDSRMF